MHMFTLPSVDHLAEFLLSNWSCDRSILQDMFNEGVSSEDLNFTSN